MTDETRKALLDFKVKYEAEAVKAKQKADEEWRPASQRDRAMTENVTFLWCANQIDQVLTEQTSEVGEAR